MHISRKMNFVFEYESSKQPETSPIKSREPSKIEKLIKKREYEEEKRRLDEEEIQRKLKIQKEKADKIRIMENLRQQELKNLAEM